MKFLRPTSALIFLLVSLEIHHVLAGLQSALRDQYDGYGEDWIFMPDGNGKPQVAILKGHGPMGRNILDDQAIRYILYTQSGPKNGTLLSANDPESLKRSDFSPTRQTKFITHGWKSSSTGSGLTNMKNAYLESGDYNVILVDWEPLASNTFYLGPMQNTGRVGADAGRFIDFLVHETGLKTEDVHFIGHSLGAHVAGNTGSSVKTGTLSRVTGLDPASPGFHMLTTTSGRLDASDADFVDVIHSCGGILGWLQPLGDADFFPNGGSIVQPGCCCLPEFTEACSHGRSYVYFTESITSGSEIKATRCDSYEDYTSKKCDNREVVNMGEHIDRSAKGSYYLTTRSEAPYTYVGTVKSRLYENNADDCDELGQGIDDEGNRICGSNSV